MMIVAVIIGAVVGAALGSFACCQAWRLRWRAQGKKSLGRRSVCMSCRKRLGWYDNIPVVSWMVLRGRCRYCRKKIGVAEIVTEVVMAVAYGGLGWKIWEVVSGSVGNYGWWRELIGVRGRMVPEWWWVFYVVVAVAGVGLAILAVYDAKWGELPSFLLTFVNVCAIITVFLRWQGGLLVGLNDWLSLAGAVGVLAGLYYLLYVFSKEKWVGGGDWILGLAIGLMLGEVWLAVAEMLVANIVTLVMAKGRREVPLGPGLIVAFAIVLLCF